MAAAVKDKSKDQAAYERQKEWSRARQDRVTKAGQGITIPEIEDFGDRERRVACMADFNLFCRTYGAAEFALPWADFHLRAIDRIQSAILKDHWYAFALPRGSGKTTLAEWGVIWAVLTGRREYVLFIGASQTLADRQLQTIKTTLATNDLLCEDFPHAVYPIHALENETRRCRGQRNAADGKNTYIEWGQSRIVLPHVDHVDSLSSGFVIECYGLETAKRGIKYKKADGTTIRPSFVIADDPQTRESAKSPSQTHTRLENLAGDVAYLAGPGKPISIVCPCTVIYEQDLADQILDRDKHPEWHGERTKMVESFPANVELWDQYADILRAALREDADASAANEFYTMHRAEMDAGVKVSWDERYEPGELSAIQHAMNKRIRDYAAFYAEFQNEPILQQQDELGMRPLDSICTHTTEHMRGVVPEACTVLTAFTDIQNEHFFTMLVGWTADFTGFVIDYFAWPEQGRVYFTRADVRRKLSAVYKGDEAARMFAALADLELKLFKTRKTTEGREITIDRWCLDGGWEKRKPAMKAWVDQSIHRSQIAITHGFGVKAKERPFSHSDRLIKQKTGPAWYWTYGKRPGGDITFDSNFWKTRAHEQLALPINAKTSIQLFKANAYEHRMLAEHLHAEKPIRVDAKGRTVFEWDDSFNRDNEGLDCLVGNMVAASIAGVVRDQERQQTKTRRLSLRQYAAAAGR